MNLKDLKNVTDSLNSTAKMPVLFLGHGTPMNAISENVFVEGFRNIRKEIPKPAAVLCISAHWETRGTYVTAMESPQTIHDFGGFPKELYEVQYPAPGSQLLAEETKSMVKLTGVQLDYNWGLDHGAWSVIKHLYPNADVPVIEMSLDYNKPPQYHYDLAGEIASLRNKGILIIGSGNMVHNLSKLNWQKLNDDDYGYDWAIEAREKMKSFIMKDDHQALIHYHSQGKSFELSIPTTEHYLPLLYVLALKDRNEPVTLFNDKSVAGSIAMTSFKAGF
jgi:4,5-DOPA dioxygenase extradiol